ncbi:MFS transporter [Legionella tunisiensis]|uniref:MFS transporter n=1 Tax=Legionella tunisiensis TaxID=1034944 RepID=UPI0012E9FD10|nr:MFS transporter [Legionella tunisiensis]
MTAFWGWSSDYLNRKKLLVVGASSLIILSYPLFCGLAVWGESFIWLFSLGFATFAGMINGSYVVLITESFPPSIRYSGVGMSYSLGIAIFGGIAPLAFTWLLYSLQITEAPALYLSCCAILTLAALLTRPRSNEIIHLNVEPIITVN